MRYLKSMTNERGYAIIEVVFLVAVIAILSTIVIPKINDEIQIAYADYIMKSIYSELRFMQVSRRTSAFKSSNILYVSKKEGSYFLVSSNAKKQYRIRINDNEELRNYVLPPKLSFETDFFMTVRDEEKLANVFLAVGQSPNSNHIKLKNVDTDKSYKPIIIYDSVGRIRFKNNDSE